MATSTPIPPSKPGQRVEKFDFTGTRDELVKQLFLYAWPTSWGPVGVVRDFAVQNTPNNREWRGRVTVTGYRSESSNADSGTLYLSVSWKQEK